MSKKPATLGASIIATKGQASPTVQNQATQAIKNNNKISANEHRIAITVRLDDERYKKLKIYGVENRLSNQDIFLAALDAYLK